MAKYLKTYKDDKFTVLLRHWTKHNDKSSDDCLTCKNVDLILHLINKSYTDHLFQQKLKKTKEQDQNKN